MKETTSLFIAIAIIVIVFLVAREIVLWYWKINTIVKNQEKTNLLLKKYFDSKGIHFTEEEKMKLELLDL
jgi:hypothetical protein